MTEICYLDNYGDNDIWVKREDLIPFSFGGNKARKAKLFFNEIDKGNYDHIITYGSGSSNHCRVIANECSRRGIKCTIISPEEDSRQTYNSQMMKLFGAEILSVPVENVHNAIETQISELREAGEKPYFIEGGGHGNIGTEAYVQCYAEIQRQEAELGIHFDYVFFASGTGTTQAGLICGLLLSGDERKIIGVSIARKNPRGRNIVLESVRSYLGNRATEKQIQDATVFVDDYTAGYGISDRRITDIIKHVMIKHGIPLDATYTGKAFLGMTDYIKKENLSKKNILFIHTGGTPLFFDLLRVQSDNS